MDRLRQRVPGKRRRQAEVNITADDVVFIGPCPCEDGENLNVPIFVETDMEVVNGTELIEAVEEASDELAMDVSYLILAYILHIVAVTPCFLRRTCIV